MHSLGAPIRGLRENLCDSVRPRLVLASNELLGILVPVLPNGPNRPPDISRHKYTCTDKLDFEPVWSPSIGTEYFEYG